MTDHYPIIKFNQRVSTINDLDELEENSVTDTAINKRRDQLDKSFENGSVQSIRTYNELLNILDDIENIEDI